MHLACSQRFDDQVDDCLLAEESAKYYANILLPLSNFVTRALEKLAGMKLPLKLVAPDHGPIWRRGIDGIIADYARWARQERTSKAIVVYDTMWQSTALMVRVIADGLSSGGCPVRVMPMSSCHRSDVATELLDAGAMVAGAPTINNTMFPTMADVLTYARGLKPRGLVGGAFGSYGWSGESIRDIAAVLGEMNVELVGQPLKVRYVPDAAALDACRKLGADIAAKLAAKRV